MRVRTHRGNRSGGWKLRLSVAAALVCMAVPAWGAGPNCAAAKRTYEANCVVCHEANGKGNAVLKSPNFTDPKWQASRSNAQLYDAIANGVKGTAMPGWKSAIKPAEINALIKCVIRGFGRKAAPAHHPSAKR